MVKCSRNSTSICHRNIEQRLKHDWFYKSQLPRTDLRYALRHADVLYTKVDAQCDKLATVIGQTKLKTLATIHVP